MKVQNSQMGEITEFVRDGTHMAIFSKDQCLQCWAQLAQERWDGLRIVTKTTVKEKGVKMGQFGNGPGHIGPGRVTCWESGII